MFKDCFGTGIAQVVGPGRRLKQVDFKVVKPVIGNAGDIFAGIRVQANVKLAYVFVDSF